MGPNCAATPGAHLRQPKPPLSALICHISPLTQACKDHAKTHSHMPCNVWVWCGKLPIISRCKLMHGGETCQPSRQQEWQMQWSNTCWPCEAVPVIHGVRARQAIPAASAGPWISTTTRRGTAGSSTRPSGTTTLTSPSRTWWVSLGAAALLHSNVLCNCLGPPPHAKKSMGPGCTRRRSTWHALAVQHVSLLACDVWLCRLHLYRRSTTAASSLQSSAQRTRLRPRWCRGLLA